ncbi:DUF4430 domain-containing protein [Clostridium sp. MSJ-8]|uniref:DUF4430 domain-containing protein n=1 Tax=Clostridium sp. MSJ-8 TaxID=2841510 RepID=UPI001C0EC988|nr:DUF4430 domain-containing protein [Clostridium sp. MSJ-8]MBU5486895.1 DUF4430 domain-containing protein [Clostridium sp. MSJ-8]
MKLNKKKLIILIGVLIVSASLIYGANYLRASITNSSNNKVASNVDDNEKSKAEIKDSKNKDNKESVEKKENTEDSSTESSNPKENSTENSNTNDKHKASSNTENNSSVNINQNQNSTSSNDNNNKNTETKNEDKNVNTVEPSIAPVEEKKSPAISMQIIDEASNSFAPKNYTLEFTKGESFNDIMKRFLPKYATDYKMIDGYLSKLFGLKERDAGINSGWIFYVNGVKSPVGMKDTYLNDGDSVIWKYVVDGVNN